MLNECDKCLCEEQPCVYTIETKMYCDKSCVGYKPTSGAWLKDMIVVIAWILIIISIVGGIFGLY